VNADTPAALQSVEPAIRALAVGRSPNKAFRSAREIGARRLAHPDDYAERESLVCHPLICAAFIEPPIQSMTPMISREGNTFLSLMRVDKTRR
jgi:hypothetical protein